MAAVCLLTLACGEGRPPPPPPSVAADERVKALADAYLDGFFARNPDQITLYGVPGRRHDKAARQLAQRLARLAGPRGRLAEGDPADRSVDVGQRFDVKAFHDRVLEDGAVPVSFLHAKIRAWAGVKS